MDSLAAIRDLLIAVGPLGVTLLSLADSAGVPTGGAPDLAVLLLASRVALPTQVALLVGAATWGSVVGCLVLYGLGRKGGESALRRFRPENRLRARKALDRYGLWAIALAMLGPPPFPTKLFVLAAGVFGMGPLPLAAGAFMGRLVRYGVMGVLGFRYGAAAMGLVKDHYLAVLIGLLLLALALWFLSRRRTGPSG